MPSRPWPGTCPVWWFWTRSNLERAFQAGTPTFAPPQKSIGTAAATAPSSTAARRRGSWSSSGTLRGPASATSSGARIYFRQLPFGARRRRRARGGAGIEGRRTRPSERSRRSPRHYCRQPTPLVLPQGMGGLGRRGASPTARFGSTRASLEFFFKKQTRALVGMMSTAFALAVATGRSDAFFRHLSAGAPMASARGRGRIGGLASEKRGLGARRADRRAVLGLRRRHAPRGFF